MSQVPTPEDNARTLLAIFRKFRTRSVLVFEDIMADWQRLGRTADDFYGGRTYAIE